MPNPKCPISSNDPGPMSKESISIIGYCGSSLMCHGQVGWMPRLPAAGAGRKADPLIISTFPGSPALCLPARSRFGEGRGGELHLQFGIYL
jgi:hypothetical protein